MITKKEVENIANLARLGLSDEEKEKLTKDLSLVLDYVSKLSELNAEKAESINSGMLPEDIVREDDEIKDIVDNQMKQTLLKAAPERDNDYFKVPSVFE